MWVQFIEECFLARSTTRSAWTSCGS